MRRSPERPPKSMGKMAHRQIAFGCYRSQRNIPIQLRAEKFFRASRLPAGQASSDRTWGRWDSAVDVGGMSKYRLTDIVQKKLRCGLRTLDGREYGHPQMFQRRIHPAMGPR